MKRRSIVSVWSLVCLLVSARTATVIVRGSPADAHPNLLAASDARGLSDGDIVSARPRAALPAYGSLDAFGRNYFPRALYDEVRAQTDVDVLDIIYRSDGFDVPGVLLQPRNRLGRKWPGIVYNRGGTGDYGRLDTVQVVELYLLARAGFVVIASDYRFHDATARRDEWGGGDLTDVLNITKTLAAIEFIDRERLFMMGLSRGGFMTYLALKHGVPVRAAAVIAAPSDLEAVGKHRPEFVNGDESFDGWARVWPDFATRAAEHFRARSAVYWADAINVPILILHSARDRLLPVGHALRMAEALQAAGRTFELHIYSKDGHSLPANRQDRNRQIVEWFEQAPARGAKDR
jgi:dipeptidyl aminopeptidase/acylaminoacyl peptidase